MSTIVFVHAFGTSGRAWAPQVAALGHRHRVLAPDLPGHGDVPGPFTLERAVNAVRAAVDEGGGRAHLVGISGGAVVALLAELEDPAPVESLVLSGGLAHAPRWLTLQRAMNRITPEPVLARVLRGPLSGGTLEHRRAAMDGFARCGKATFLAALRELAGLDLRPRLGRVAVPTLVLCGAKDRANIALSRELAAGIPSAELRIVPGANHLWNLQQPEIFNHTVGAFVDRASSPEA
jgi:3-oxoadipate enol-lactonase